MIAFALDDIVSMYIKLLSNADEVMTPSNVSTEINLHSMLAETAFQFLFLLYPACELLIQC